MTTDDIADVLWDTTPPPGARRSIQVYIHRLRRALDEPALIHHDLAGYRIVVQPDQLDALRFVDLAGQGRTARQRGDLDRASTLLGRALDLWRGSPYADIDQGRVIADEILRLEEQRLLIVQDRLEVELDLGRPAQAVATLAGLAAAYPYRERLHALHMLALYRCGRQTEALEVFRNARDRLGVELGVEPGELLQRLHHAVLQTDERLPYVSTGTLDSTWKPAPPAPAITIAVPRELPGDVAGFAGRDEALATLEKQLPEDNLVAPAPVIFVIAGTAGVGKTALAVHWAHRVADRFPDGQLHVNLHGFDPVRPPMEPAEALRGFLDALGIPPHRVPANLDAQARLFRSFVADKRVLVVLDNARDAAQVRPLLPGSGSCLVLVTSRNQLASLVATNGAHPLVLDLLTPDEARHLLARRLSPDRLAVESEATDEIIAHCSGLPLALAIVAARLATHPRSPLGHAAADLRNARTRLDALSDPDPTTDLRAALDVSYRSLTPGAARLFQLLALHPGPEVSVPAAASLAGISSAQVSALLAELTRTHLLDQPVAGRYRFHDLLRAYAAERASTAEADRPAATRRMLDHYLHTAHAAAGLLYPQRTPMALAAASPGTGPEDLADPHSALAWFARERAVLLEVIAHAAATDADRLTWQLAQTIGEFLRFRGYWQALAETQSIALDAAVRLADPHAQAHARRTLGNCWKTLGRYDDAVTHLTRALRLFHDLDDPSGEGRTQLALVDLRDRQGRHREALAHAEQALALLRRADGDPVALAAALNAVGWLHAQLGDYQRTLSFCQEALALQQATGNRVCQSSTWDSLAYAHHRLGDHRRAIGCYRRAVDLAREHGNRLQEAGVLTHLGDAQAAIGETGAARETWQRAQTILAELGHADADQVRERLKS